MRIKQFSNDQNRCDVSAGMYMPQSLTSRAWTIRADSDLSNIKLGFKQKILGTNFCFCTSNCAVSNCCYKRLRTGTTPTTTATRPVSPHAICCLKQVHMLHINLNVCLACTTRSLISIENSFNCVPNIPLNVLSALLSAQMAPPHSIFFFPRKKASDFYPPKAINSSDRKRGAENERKEDGRQKERAC